MSNLPAVLNPEDFAVINIEKEDLVEIINENLAGDEISFADLSRINVPVAGVTAFNVDGEMTKDVKGIVVSFSKRRGYWEEKYDGANAKAPVCSSKDGITGERFVPLTDEESTRLANDPDNHGIEGLSYDFEGTPQKKVCIDCSTCPLAQFGANNDVPPCRETAQLFLLQEDSLLPMIVNVPPTSLKNFRSYRTKLAARGKVYYSVITSMSLKEEVTKRSNRVNRLEFEKDGELTAAQKDQVKAYVKALKPIITGADVSQDDFE